MDQTAVLFQRWVIIIMLDHIQFGIFGVRKT